MKPLEPDAALQTQLSALELIPSSSLHTSRQIAQGSCLVASGTKVCRLKENRWGN